MFRCLILCIVELTTTFDQRLGLLAVVLLFTPIPANIAEGQGRRFTKEFLSYLANARGSLWELDSNFELAVRLGFLDPKLHVGLQNQMDEVGRILNGLMRSVTNSSQA